MVVSVKTFSKIFSWHWKVFTNMGSIILWAWIVYFKKPWERARSTGIHFSVLLTQRILHCSSRCFMFPLSCFTRHSGLYPQILKNSSSRKLVLGRYLTQQWEKQPTQLAWLQCSLLIVSPFCIFSLRHLVHYSFCYHHYPDDSHNCSSGLPEL